MGGVSFPSGSRSRCGNQLMTWFVCFYSQFLLRMDLSIWAREGLMVCSSSFRPGLSAAAFPLLSWSVVQLSHLRDARLVLPARKLS